METKYQDFIGFYTNVFPEGFCQHVIEEFDYSLDRGAGFNRQTEERVRKLHKEDDYLFLNAANQRMNDFGDKRIIQTLFDGIQECYNQYSAEYDVLNSLPIRCTNLKLQKTKPGGGYHVWHCEQGRGETSARCLVYSIYLNTIEEAGETEFIYQKIRIPPRENSVILFPASYTHTHRGNAVYGEKPKYIVTGWFYIE